MRYVCLGYMDETRWEAMSPAERGAMVADCLAYDAVLRDGNHFVAGEALQSVRNAATVRWHDGRPLVTDGPFAETKEQLGGIMVLEARDLNHAIQLMSQHPGVRHGGCFEIRPVEDIGVPVRLSAR